MSDAESLVSGAMNFRDVGGLRADRGVTRSGVLFRSGNLARVDVAGRATLSTLGLRRIIDLRDDDEVRSAPSLLGDLTVETVRVPLFLGSVASFFEEDVSLEEMYRRLVDDSAAAVAEVVRGIVTDQPVLVHCTVGKDRTGVTVALTLAAAGVEGEAVVADYARTESMLPARRNSQIVAWLKAQHPSSVHAADLATRAPAPVMRAALQRIAADHGSVAEYLRANGVTDDELVELRRVLVASD